MIRYLFRALIISLALGAAAQAHLVQVAAGATDTTGDRKVGVGDRLSFVDGYMPSMVYHLVPRTGTQQYSGYFSLDDNPRTLYPYDNFSFTAVSSGGAGGVAGPGHAAAGSQIWLEVTSVMGPAGAKFGFWDENETSAPTKVFATGQDTGGFKFVLSEGPDAPGESPGGHIERRAFTADKAGDYYVTFTLYDMSTQNNGGPIHTPSVPYVFHFQAVPEPSTAGLWLAGTLVLGWRRRRQAR